MSSNFLVVIGEIPIAYINSGKKGSHQRRREPPLLEIGLFFFYTPRQRTIEVRQPIEKLNARCQLAPVCAGRLWLAIFRKRIFPHSLPQVRHNNPSECKHLPSDTEV